VINHPDNRLAELMEARGVSRRDLAVALDVTEDTIRRFKENRGGPIPSKYIPTLVVELETEPSYLMGWDREAAESGKAAA
jgi:transcriptional regulator with XRE-family HTH domain